MPALALAEAEAVRREGGAWSLSKEEALPCNTDSSISPMPPPALSLSRVRSNTRLRGVHASTAA